MSGVFAKLSGAFAKLIGAFAKESAFFLYRQVIFSIIFFSSLQIRKKNYPTP
jgi:hypothetical protein